MLLLAAVAAVAAVAAGAPTPGHAEVKELKELKEEVKEELGVDALRDRELKALHEELAGVKAELRLLRETKAEEASHLHFRHLHGETTRDLTPLAPPANARHVFFLKTHKTASTTVSTVLFRYCRMHGLRCYTKYWGNAGHARDEAVDVYASHLSGGSFVSHEAQYRALVPDGLFTTIFREPVERFISGFYFQKQKAPIAEFVDVHYQHIMQGGPAPDKRRYALNTFTFFNRQANELGYIGVVEPLPYLRSMMHLVGLTSHVNEYLMMLRAKMGLELDDFLYFVQRHSDKHAHAAPVPEKTLQQLRELNYLDIRLYEAAVAMFEDEVEAMPDQFLRDVETFTAYNDAMQDWCFDKTLPDPSNTTLPADLIERVKEIDCAAISESKQEFELEILCPELKEHSESTFHRLPCERMLSGQWRSKGTPHFGG